MKKTEPNTEISSVEADEIEEPVERPGSWIFAMLADLGIGPTSGEVETGADEK